ncbi:LCP family protein [Thermocrispum municipale]|uniref:LCP family protein n=1 Tax=Thermocrispum municipale TaxID=37926 RepID=UPI0003F4D16D|nr:LCP family protein [Thermocrispum municipale]
MAYRPRSDGGRRLPPSWHSDATRPVPRATPPRPHPSGRPPAGRAGGAPPRRPAGRQPAKKPTPPNVPALAGKIIVALVSVLVIAFTGYGYASLQNFTTGMESVDVIAGGDSGPLPADGSRDILLVGMDSRQDTQGKTLPKSLLKKFKAGKDEGENNTDTMILLHIPNDGSKAVAISLPRDSYVEIADGYGKHKLNSAYGRAKNVTARELRDSGETDERTIFRKSNQAGAKLLIKTVEDLTGRTIDNYASVNLLGFYEITQALGGVEVCLKEATQDEKSGANFKAGKQTISGVKALAFVRQRHGLPRGDLDRVVRQQVFMAGLARKTISSGTLTDPGKLSDLAKALKRSVVLNHGWDIIDFAKQMSGLSGGQVQFTTIPVVGDISTPEDGLALEVDPQQVREFIASLSGSVKKPVKNKPDPKHAQVTVDVMNGVGVTGLAARVMDKLSGLGFKSGTTGDIPPQDTTVVKHAPGEKEFGQMVVDSLPVSAQLVEDEALNPGQVHVLIGADYPEDGGGDATGGGSQPQGASQHATLRPAQQPQQEDDEKPITADGIRCVY